MKIIENNRNNLEPFGDLDDGEVFLLDEIYSIKTDRQHAARSGFGLDLKSGALYVIEWEREVQHMPKATLGGLE